jgi:hypothetical protein
MADERDAMKIESLDHFVEIVGERIELVAAAGFEQVGMVEDSRYRQKHHNGKKPRRYWGARSTTESPSLRFVNVQISLPIQEN